MKKSRLLTMADAYAKLDLCVIPIASGTKKPAVEWKRYQTTQPTEAVRQSWWKDGSTHGIAVVCGAPSNGVIVRDFDNLGSYHDWADSHQDLARTLPTVETSRGRHVYARCEALQEHGSGLVVIDDGELRGTGGYVVAPPSLHPDGMPYRWVGSFPRSIPTIDFSTSGFIPGVGVTERTEESAGQRMPLGGLPPQPSKNPSSSVVSVVSVVSVLSVTEAIESTLPKSPGNRNRQVFELCRALKSVPHLVDAEVNSLEPIVRDWHRRALPHISTEPFIETWIDFIRGWPRVQIPKGASPMAALFAKALRSDPPAEVARHQSAGLSQLAALCRELQRANGTDPFYLGCRTAGELLDIGHVKAWRWLTLLEHDRVIVCVEKGSRSARRATRFRYRGAL